MSSSPIVLHSTGHALLEAMLPAMEAATTSLRFEFYIVTDSEIGRRFRDALTAAARRGLRVRALVDAWGSMDLYQHHRGFFDPLVAAGGEFCWFNPDRWLSRPFRDHRKALVCDERTVFLGGCNIAPEYHGDGVAAGWRDCGVEIQGPAAQAVAAAFDAQWELAAGRVNGLPRQPVTLPCGPDTTLLLTRPGLGRNPLQTALMRDLATAGVVRITSAYFLPNRQLRASFQRAARRGARVELLLAGRSDVALSQWATRSLYRRLLNAGVIIHEYQPQILHTKLLVVDDVVYAGSSNLDPRSLRLNFEIMVRLEHPALAREAGALFDADRVHSRTLTARTWREARSWHRRLAQRLAFLLLARMDVDWTLSRLRRLTSRWKRHATSVG